jgi:sulfide:quinone oxidoreductase
VLVVALGADLDPAATPGLLEGGYEFYSVKGAEGLRDVLPGFKSGVAIIGVLGPFFKCPPAPFEAAMLLHDYLTDRGGADAVTIRVLSPMSSPIPISQEISEGILAGLASRGIEFWPETKVTRLDPERSVAILGDGRSIDYDLFLGIPVHRAPAVVESSALAVEGWIPVDTATFRTSFPEVYAIGDVTSAPVPRAGVFAEGEAATLADHLIAKIRGEGPPVSYGGIASCYVEFGGGPVARADVEFLTGPAPSGRFQPPSLEIKNEKKRFARDRRARWFGHRLAEDG